MTDFEKEREFSMQPCGLNNAQHKRLLKKLARARDARDKIRKELSHMKVLMEMDYVTRSRELFSREMTLIREKRELLARIEVLSAENKAYQEGRML